MATRITTEIEMLAFVAARAIYGANGGKLGNGKPRSEYGVARRVAEAILGERHPERGALRAKIEADLVMYRDARNAANAAAVRARGDKGSDCGACDAVTECLCR